MKIVNVTPGLIPIPPPTWGAVEKIIWEIHNNLLKLGYDSKIKYLDDVKPTDDIVHIHVANLANMAYERGIPYYFTMHDHHSYLYGKDSYNYKENLQAMKNAIKAFVPAKYLVDYFEGVPEYFSHGVNTDYFVPNTFSSERIKKEKMSDIKLLCVANNGFIHDQSEDRKGFGLAIEAAERLNLPITIAGPSNNKKYFEQHPSTYDKLTILYDLSEDELLKVYQTHSIFIHMSILEAGHPNLTLLEALSCGLPIVGTLEENNSLKGMITVNRNIDELINGIEKIRNDYQNYWLKAIDQSLDLSWKNRTKELVKIYNINKDIEYVTVTMSKTLKKKETMREQLINEYGSTKKLGIESKKPEDIIAVDVNFNFIEGPFVEIRETKMHKYLVQFINGDTNRVEYQLEMEGNHWARASKKFYQNWVLRVKGLDTEFFHEHIFNPEGQRILISFESKSLGDTLSWMPYVDKFQKEHKCEVICSTFLNKLFIEQYPNIQFVEPGTVVDNIYGSYYLGIFYDEEGQPDLSKNPIDSRKIPLGKIASDILGVQYDDELKPKIPLNKDVIIKKQISIATHSSAQCKYWNNPKGWQTVVNYLNDKGYTVRLLSQEEDGYMGNPNPYGVKQHRKGPLTDVIKTLQESELFIGISGGLSWLAWATGTPTILISGFTEKISEPVKGIHRIINENVCNGCWSYHKFDPGNWNWCPEHQGTPREFECSKSITAEMVINEINDILSL